MCVHVSCVSADAHVPCHACGSQRIFLSHPSILVYKCWDYRCVSQHCAGYLHPRDQTFRSQLFLSAMAPGDWIQVVWHAQQVILITKPFWWSCTNLKKNYFDFMCLHVKAYMFVCAPHVCLVPREARRGRRSSWGWVTAVVSHLVWVGAGAEPGLFLRQHVLFNAEQSPQLLHWCLIFLHYFQLLPCNP